MNLVLHIAKSDLRHTWPYAAVWLAALAASWWINLQVLADRIEYVGLQGADAIAHAALALFTAMLFLAGPRPGARPMRSRDLLLAKALTLGLTAVLPFALTHWATVALRGFPLQDHALELTWNAALMVASCAVPVAALASVSRNLQTVVLMLLAGLVVTFGPYVRYAPDRPWGQEATALWLVLAGSAGVLCWQVRFRREIAGRIALATVCLLSASTAYWPAAWWPVLRRAASPSPPPGGEGALSIDLPHYNWLSPNNRYYRVPWYQLDKQTIVVKLLPGWDGRIVQWEVDWPWSEKITTQVELLGPRKHYALPLNQSAHLPGAGWCRATVDTALRVECHNVLAPPGTLGAQWGSVSLFKTERPSAPRWALPVWHPVQRHTGRLHGGGSYDGRTLTIEARQPILYVFRQLVIDDSLFR